jgi:ribosome-associated toxin RatA of RatAB toxin-antitoxin module
MQNVKHTVEKSQEVPYSAAQVYELVADVDRYHEFVPWCTGSRILEQEGDGVVAELRVGYGKLSTSFRTRNRNRPGEAIEMELHSGPFKRLEGRWDFVPGETGATRVTLKIHFEPTAELLGFALDRLVSHEAQTLVEAFCERARKLHGDVPAAS